MNSAKRGRSETGNNIIMGVKFEGGPATPPSYSRKREGQNGLGAEENQEVGENIKPTTVEPQDASLGSLMEGKGKRERGGKWGRVFVLLQTR